MKVKYYLRGLGTGILFATIVLCIAYSYRNSTNKDTQKDTGKVVEQDKESSLSTEPSTSEEKSSIKESNTSEESTTPKESITPEESTTPKESATSEESTTPKDSTTPEESSTEEETTPEQVIVPIGDDNTVTTVEFTIYSGYTSHDVANLLATMGVIGDATEFDRYLSQNGYDYRIATGIYTVTVGESFESIAKKITN